MKNIYKKFDKPVHVNNRNFQKDAPLTQDLIKLQDEIASKFPVNKNNLVSNRRLINNVRCLACNSSKSEQLFVKYGFKYVECSNCGHVYVENLLKENVLLKYYSESHMEELNNKVQKDKKRSLYWDKLYLKYIDLFDNYLGVKRILDIGTGAGNFLKLCKRKKINDIYGLDFSAKSKEDVNKIIPKENYIFRVPMQELPKLKIKPFDMITMWGVLEHLSNPFRDFKALNKIIKKNGYCFALFPNLKSKAYEMMGVTTPTISPTEHISFFSLKSLNTLAKRTGFKVEYVFNELPVIDLMYPHCTYSKEFVDDIINSKKTYYWACLFKKAL